MVFIYIIFFNNFLPNQNNPTAVWLRLIGMHNEKTWFWKFLKTELSVFANELFICLFVCLCNSQVFDEQLDESVPDTSEADTATSNPLITIQESDKVRPLRGRQFKFITLDHFKDLPDVNVVFFTIAPSCIIFAELNPILVSFYFWGAGSKK